MVLGGIGVDFLVVSYPIFHSRLLLPFAMAEIEEDERSPGLLGNPRRDDDLESR